MNMDDDDLDDDVDIDSLLQACDNLVDVPKSSSTGSIKQPLKSNLKETTSVDSFRSAAAPLNPKKERQSVRFSKEVEESGHIPQRSELADILLQDDPTWGNKVNPDDRRSASFQNQEPSNAEFGAAPANKRTSSASAKDDWLGLDDNNFDSPYNSLDMFSGPRTGGGPLIRSFDADEPVQREPITNAEEPPSIDTSDLLKMLASGKGSKKSDTNLNAKKPPVPPSSSGRRNLDSLGNSRSQSPVSAPPRGFQQSEPQTNPRNPSFPMQDSFPDQFSRIGDQQPRQALASFNQFPTQQAPAPTFPSSNNADTDAPKTGSSFLESLPFLNKAKEVGGKKNAVDFPGSAGGGDIGDSNPGVQSDKSVKKKGSGTKISGGTGLATLQLPSHLVNEDELKVMSSSLKTLYANQLEMLENSYKEQLEFLSLSNKRREDLLKDEMSNLREDYEQRLQRMRAELVKNEGLSVDRVQEDMNKLSDLVSKLGTKLENVQSTESSFSSDELKSDLVKEFRKLLDGHNEDNLRRIGSSLEQEMQKSFHEAVQRATSTQSVHLEELKKRFENVVENKELWNDKILDKIESSEKHRQEEFQRVLKAQRRINEAGVNSVVQAVLKLFENQKDVSKRKGDRLAVQIKEFRKDLRRLYADLETRNDSVHKSQFSIEMEQRTITQAVRDINTILKLVTSSNSNQSRKLFGGDTNDPNSQYSLIHATQLQTQNEMEMKLMKEERRALSDSIAQMNVERRKLGDEKVALERERLEFEKEKARVRELEMQAKSRIMEAEEMKRNAESLRLKESQLSQETESKMREVTKEKSRLKERYFEIEQTLRMKEQKLYQDKCDLLKEKEFMDKLRDQLLCPGCLNSTTTNKCVSSSALMNLSAPPSYNSIRSDGDGVELAMNDHSNLLLHTVPAPKLNLSSPEDDAFYRSRNKLLLQQLQSQAYTDL